MRIIQKLNGKIANPTDRFQMSFFGTENRFSSSQMGDEFFSIDGADSFDTLQSQAVE